MVRPPSHIFIVRHGSRLDSADKDWHLTSATPFDTPLTYGGFLQARQVGNQISSLLAQAKVDAEVSKNGEVISGRRRRFRIVIHTSPYLRCLQTSIGISSGLSQTPTGSVYQPSDLIVPRGPPDASQSQRFKSTLIRVDAFLGEWLTPEYFERITPPPDAALMVVGAKAELLRREDYSMYTAPVHTMSHRPRASTSSLWNGAPSLPFPDLAALPPPIGENNGDACCDGSAATTPVRITPRQKSGYVAPQAPFAISSRGKAPEGLVAHARDACTLVDYPWDSMSAPLSFGDGGVLGDEWATMHKRFRSGLRKMVNWYATTEKPAELQPMQSGNQPDKTEKEGDDDDGTSDGAEEDIETVVILVSHGAGCNAMMGAVTDQPVLRDVGIASISMAVRRENFDYAQALLRTRPQDAALLRLVPVDQMYEMKMEVSTDHLRPGTSASVTSPDTARPTSASSSTWSAFGNSGRRGRTGTESSTTIGGPVMNPFAHRDSVSSAGGREPFAAHAAGISSRRQSFVSRTSQASGMGISGQASTSGNEAWSNGTPPSGLWSPVSSSLFLMDDDDTDGPVDEFDSHAPDFDNLRLTGTSLNEKTRRDRATAPTAARTSTTTTSSTTAAPAPVTISSSLPSPTATPMTAPTTTTTAPSVATTPATPSTTAENSAEDLPLLISSRTRRSVAEDGFPEFGFAIQPSSSLPPMPATLPDRSLFPTSIRIKRSSEIGKLSDEVSNGEFGDVFGGGWGFAPASFTESESSFGRRWAASERF